MILLLYQLSYAADFAPCRAGGRAKNGRDHGRQSQGTASDPVFKPDLKGLATEQLKAVRGEAGAAAADFINGLFSGKKKKEAP